MTVPQPINAPQEPPARSGEETPQVSAWRRIGIFGTGFGVAVANGDLEAVIVRSRASASTVVASTVVRNFVARPAAEWGTELSQFLASAGEPHLAATLILPREDVIVRTLRLSGVAEKDTAAAIELQLDTLHPWDEEPIAWAWWRLSPSEVAVGIARESTLSHYETLFSEAGIPMAAVTFSAAVIHTALRLHHVAPASIFCYTCTAAGRVEVYGESESKPCYSAGFAMASERALPLARAELRLPHDCATLELSDALSAQTPGAGDRTKVPAIAYAAALASSAPLTSRFANLLPAARRASHSRTQYLIPATLGALLLLALLAVLVLFPWLNERRYVADLTAEQHKLQPSALRVQTIDKTLAAHRARIASLDDFRHRPQADLDVLNELVRILPDKAWTSSIEIFPDSVVIAGETEQAAPLLKLLDSSPLFQNSEFVMSVTHNGQTDQFRIKSIRRGRAGRNTP